MIPLFKRYPNLRGSIPHVSLGRFPTAIERMDTLGKKLVLNNLYIKRDDLSGEIYGGNKVRKLEFILAGVSRSKAKAILTYGYAGSNHALATSLYAKKLGIRSISMLLPQPNAHYVRQNLLLNHYFGAELHHYPNIPALYMGTAYQVLRNGLRDGRFPKLIPPGGSTPEGTLGFVNAAFELDEQIKSGLISEPDFVYFPLGTVGTASGFILGMKAMGRKTKVVSVRVTPTKYGSAKNMLMLLRKTNSLLRKADPRFPKLIFSERDFEIKHDQFGERYSLFTKEGISAIKLMKETEGIKLDGTYTGKTLAALIKDSREENMKDKVILFWNTYNSVDFSKTIEKVDYKKLPRKFHSYFEEEVQPLDRR
ncbi:MAG: pyridoxal-phosphate dependent enzyme [Thermoplasmata archaeon]|nr:MAG: pyridoxal-phosphate dependent enzyme [Thermoplasmata archaeon]